MRLEDKKVLFYFILFSFVFFLDRILKLWTISSCNNSVKILPFFSINSGLNQGVSFGIFNSEKNKYFIIGLIIIIICALLWITYKRIKNKLGILAEFLVLTGAFGNLLDRFTYGAVVDFLLLSYGSFSFPVFNISDIAICLGVVIMLFRRDKE
jgi:signal peptidase II